MNQEEFERVLFFEAIRQKAAEDYLVSPNDVGNLTRWGAALLELAKFKDGLESLDLLRQAQSKLEEALKIDSRKHEALWCLGSVFMAFGFMAQNVSFFDRATESFQKAVDEMPINEQYAKSLEMSKMAPGILAEAIATANSAPASAPAVPQARGNSDFMYDVLGWVVLAIGVVTWMKYNVR